MTEENRVIAGLLTRADIGDERYDAIISDYAGSICVSMGAETREKWLARSMGFRSPGDLADFLADEAIDSQTRKQVEQLLPQARRLLVQYEECRGAAWDEYRTVEVFDPLEPHDHEKWRRDRGMPSKATGAVTTRKTTRVGDRQFVLHFDSADYPNFDAACKTLGRDVRRIGVSIRSRAR